MLQTDHSTRICCHPESFITLIYQGNPVAIRSTSTLHTYSISDVWFGTLHLCGRETDTLMVQRSREEAW